MMQVLNYANRKLRSGVIERIKIGECSTLDSFCLSPLKHLLAATLYKRPAMFDEPTTKGLPAGSTPPMDVFTSRMGHMLIWDTGLGQ